MDRIYKTPRLFIDAPLVEALEVRAPKETAHYLKNVIKLKEGESLRLFNGRDGEFKAFLQAYESKNNARLYIKSRHRPQPQASAGVHLVFPPLKKEALDFLIEKAVELGVTHFHPILTQNTDVRRLNEARLKEQIIQAAEQCERLDIPSLVPLRPLDEVLKTWETEIPLFVAIERSDASALLPALQQKGRQTKGFGFVIGPAGGFSNDEKEGLSSKGSGIIPVSLGERILRAETAALMMLSVCAALSAQNVDAIA